MVAPALVDADVQLGRELYEALGKDPVLAPSAAMWLYDEDAHEWRFLIATADAEKRGPQAAYLRVRNVLKKNGLLQRLPFQRFVVVAPSEPVITSMARFVSVGADAEPDLYDCLFNGIRVPGAHVYALNRT